MVHKLSLECFKLLEDMLYKMFVKIKHFTEGRNFLRKAKLGSN